MISFILFFLTLGGLKLIDSPRDSLRERAVAALSRGPTVKLKSDSSPSSEDYTRVNFRLLAKSTVLSDGEIEKVTVPDEIQALDEELVELHGYLLPVELKEGKLASFLLLSDQLACCYGVEPAVNSWVYVTLDEPSEVLVDQLILVRGRFFVQPLVEGGQVLGIYGMQGKQLLPATVGK